jgi:hypothetical protein
MPHFIFLHKFLERGQEVSHCETFKLGNCSQEQLPNFFAEDFSLQQFFIFPHSQNGAWTRKRSLIGFLANLMLP